MADPLNPRDWWYDDPKFPVGDWQFEVANGDTRLGYRDWIANQRENRLEDEEEHDDTPSLQDSGVYDHADPRNR